MTTPNDGGPVSLRDWFAAHETIGEFDHPENNPGPFMCQALAGPMPEGGWGGCKTKDQWIAMLAWEARWRAALRYIRADAMIAAGKDGR